MKKQGLTIYQLFLRPFTAEGTLKAAEKLIGHIAECGFDIIYLCPVSTADSDENPAYWSERQKDCGLNNPKNPYRMSDYFNVDPEYGTNESLKDFINTAHSYGLKVILDLVYFHCGPKAVFLDEHKDFVKCDENRNIIYGEWHFPTLNFDNPELCEYLWSNMEYYIRDFKADGFRCDVAYLCPTSFWEEGRRRIEKINPDVFMLNEGENADALNFAFDANYHYDWMEFKKKIFDGSMPASALRETYEKFGNVADRCIRAIDSHDGATNYDGHFEATAGHNAVNAALVVDFTADGIPFVYNGYEIADTNHHSIFANRFHGKTFTIHWENGFTDDGKDRLDLIKTLCRIKHGEPAIYSGSMEWIDNDKSDKIISFIRKDENNAVLVVVNAAKETVTVKMNVENFNDSKPIISYGADDIKDGKITLKANGYAVLKKQINSI